ncbi:MAG: CopG family transcriptional regulator [Candidatus Hadarchaeum sp.]|uniref:ribbon-helix-helix domain-containing protein n=1 Tax=Candidatus Hadarchaeum sp. TaxID=2883567 RepID=UPI0031773159
MAKKRTQAYFDPDLHARLKARAKEEGVSLAELLRRIARACPQRELTPQAYQAIVGLGAGGKQDISENHDTYLASSLS